MNPEGLLVRRISLCHVTIIVHLKRLIVHIKLLEVEYDYFLLDDNVITILKGVCK